MTSVMLLCLVGMRLPADFDDVMPRGGGLGWVFKPLITRSADLLRLAASLPSSWTPSLLPSMGGLLFGPCNDEGTSNQAAPAINQ
ncbi:hypothetical protein EB796_011524 [Bugula neritina]|uniref:Secreted protein n=1 Tax=Bugula neritina TaxID=10212 RepID=A0A7J7JWW9_BUGNE|nr:hypothetical protein EB796_011524 [Bugula neritina]